MCMCICFCIRGRRILQTVEESVPQRVLIAADAAKKDLMAWVYG